MREHACGPQQLRPRRCEWSHLAGSRTKSSPTSPPCRQTPPARCCTWRAWRRPRSARAALGSLAAHAAACSAGKAAFSHASCHASLHGSSQSNTALHKCPLQCCKRNAAAGTVQLQCSYVLSALVSALLPSSAANHPPQRAQLGHRAAQRVPAQHQAPPAGHRQLVQLLHLWTRKSSSTVTCVVQRLHASCHSQS